MKNVTDDFKIDIRTYGRQFDVKLKANDADISNDYLNYLKPSFNASLFKTVMHQIEIDTKVYMPINTKITGQIGVKVNEKTYNYIDLNTYYVKSCERQEDTNSYKVLAYTKMKEAMTDSELELTEKMTVRNYLIAICQKLNWDTNNIPETFINSEKLIDPILHTGIGYTYRDILDEIATITCSFLLFKGEEFHLIYPTETNQEIDESYLDEDNITIGEKCLINSLVFSRVEESDSIYRKDDESIEANGLHEYKISDCQLLSTNDRAEYIDAMFDYLKTLEFYIFDVQSKGILFLEMADIFSFKLSGISYKTILLNSEIELDDGLKEKLYTDEPDETETEYKYADSTDKKINQAYILVDKQNQKIAMLSQSVSESEDKIAELEITNEQIEQTVASNKIASDNDKQELLQKFDNYAPTSEITRVENKVTQLQTDTYTKTQIDTKLEDGSVTKLKSTTLLADDDGLTVDKSDSKTKSNLDADGLTILDKTGSTNDTLLRAQYDEEKGETVVETKNLYVQKYLVVAETGRLEKYTRADGKVGVGGFYVGG